MNYISRRTALRLATGSAAFVFGAAVSRAAEGGSGAGQSPGYRIEANNWTGKDAALTLVGAEKTLSTKVAPAYKPFEIVGGGDLPAGDYVYAARTAGGDLVAYGKLAVTKSGPVWIFAGVDQCLRKLFTC